MWRTQSVWQGSFLFQGRKDTDYTDWLKDAAHLYMSDSSVELYHEFYFASAESETNHQSE